MRARWVIAGTTAIFALMGSYWTSLAQTGPTFEVSPASPNDRAESRNSPSRTPQSLSFQATLVSDIIAFAYELQPDQTEKWPQWMYDIRYNVAVTTAVPTSLSEQRRLLQTLLEQHFSLVAHRISHRIPAYFLVQGTNVNLIPSLQTEEVSDFCSRRLRDAIAELGLDPLSLRNSSPCVAPTSLSGLATKLSKGMQATVFDKTGISGLFDIEYGAGAPPALSEGRLDNLPPICIRGAPCGQAQDYTSWLNRLGLKLELHRDTLVEALVIEHIEKPI